MPRDEIPLMTHWERAAGDILDRTQRFPKAVRFTFATRIDNLVLDVLDNLVMARFAPRQEKAACLRRIDTDLARLRVLLRMCHARRYLDTAALERLARGLDEAGRMAGGWLRHLSGTEAAA